MWNNTRKNNLIEDFEVVTIVSTRLSLTDLPCLRNDLLYLVSSTLSRNIFILLIIFIVSSGSFLLPVPRLGGRSRTEQWLGLAHSTLCCFSLRTYVRPRESFVLLRFALLSFPEVVAVICEHKTSEFLSLACSASLC